MALAVNTQAPDFTLPSTSGKDFCLSEDLKDKPCIIYFYPKDFTRGCTAEACDFRDNISFFKGMEIEVIGVSRDSIATHLKFQAKHELPFQLLADVKGDVARMYDSLIPIIGLPTRTTYLLDKNHKIVAVYDSFFGFRNHLKEMIAQVNEGKIEK
jgi:thioredoxin-dependent peroxiredoxin